MRGGWRRKLGGGGREAGGEGNDGVLRGRPGVLFGAARDRKSGRRNGSWGRRRAEPRDRGDRAARHQHGNPAGLWRRQWHHATNHGRDHPTSRAFGCWRGWSLGSRCRGSASDGRSSRATPQCAAPTRPGDGPTQSEAGNERHQRSCAATRAATDAWLCEAGHADNPPGAPEEARALRRVQEATPQGGLMEECEECGAEKPRLCGECGCCPECCECADSGEEEEEGGATNRNHLRSNRSNRWRSTYTYPSCDRS